MFTVLFCFSMHFQVYEVECFWQWVDVQVVLKIHSNVVNYYFSPSGGAG